MEFSKDVPVYLMLQEGEVLEVAGPEKARISLSVTKFEGDKSEKKYTLMRIAGPAKIALRKVEDKIK